MLETEKVASEKLQKIQKESDTPERKGENNYMSVAQLYQTLYTHHSVDYTEAPICI